MSYTFINIILKFETNSAKTTEIKMFRQNVMQHSLISPTFDLVWGEGQVKAY